MKIISLITLITMISTATQAQSTASDTLKRGEYLTRAADCVVCHTMEGGKPFAGGRPFKTPIGTIYSTNITADQETGIGNWSDEDFLRALHEGKDRDGENLYPAMPYTSYTLLTKEDVQLIKEYLFSLPPVEFNNKKNEIIFPFNSRIAISVWNLINFKNRRFKPDEKMKDTWNRGAYLVEALGHCGECHTPRNILLGTKTKERYAGAILDGWYAFNITDDKTAGIGSWSQKDIVEYLRHGTVEKSQAAGPMAEVIEHSTSYLTDTDLKAMAYYLSTIEGKNPNEETRGRTSWGSLDQSVEIFRGEPFPTANVDGVHLYLGNCASCHSYNGAGSKNNYYPSLIHNSSVGAPAINNLVMVILNGVQRDTDEEEIFMPAFSNRLNDKEIALLANYILQQFGRPQLSVTAEEVEKLRQFNPSIK